MQERYRDIIRSMEPKPKYKKHSETLDSYCKDCKEVIHLLLYMEKEVLPNYKTEIENLKKNAHPIQKSVKSFLLSGR